jgi:hypothetical protein
MCKKHCRSFLGSMVGATTDIGVASLQIAQQAIKQVEEFAAIITSQVEIIHRYESLLATWRNLYSQKSAHPPNVTVNGVVVNVAAPNWWVRADRNWN